jgi:adenylylsulfate kinase
MQKGVVVWFTGLPNSGKSTISKSVKNKLDSTGHTVELLDSDEVPRSLTKDLSPDWSIRQIQKCNNLIFISNILYKHNIIVLLSSVGRFRKMREKAREEIRDFVEVYLKCPLHVRLKRDGITQKYKRYPSTINVYQEPENPEILIETDLCPPDQAAVQVMDYLAEKGYIKRMT